MLGSLAALAALAIIGDVSQLSLRHPKQTEAACNWSSGSSELDQVESQPTWGSGEKNRKLLSKIIQNDFFLNTINHPDLSFIHYVNIFALREKYLQQLLNSWWRTTLFFFFLLCRKWIFWQLFPTLVPRQRPSLVTVVEWIDYETLALLFGMVRLLSHVSKGWVTRSGTGLKTGLSQIYTIFKLSPFVLPLYEKKDPILNIDWQITLLKITDVDQSAEQLLGIRTLCSHNLHKKISFYCLLRHSHRWLISL